MTTDACILHAGTLVYPDSNTFATGKRFAEELERWSQFMGAPESLNLVPREEFTEAIPGDDENVTFFLFAKMGGNGLAYGMVLALREACDPISFDSKSGERV